MQHHLSLRKSGAIIKVPDLRQRYLHSAFAAALRGESKSRGDGDPVSRRWYCKDLGVFLKASNFASFLHFLGRDFCKHFS